MLTHGDNRTKGGANAAAARRRAENLEANAPKAKVNVCQPFFDLGRCQDHPADRHHFMLDSSNLGVCLHCGEHRQHKTWIAETAEWREAMIDKRRVPPRRKGDARS